MGWLESIALAAFVSGALGGVHCAAMCGGVVCLLSTDGCGQAATDWRRLLSYNAGRILSYTAAGMIAGMAGQAGLMLRGTLPVQQAFMIAAGVTLCVMALYLAGFSPLTRALEGAGALLWRQVRPMAQRMLPATTAPKALGLGMVWGAMPCGMVYAALLLALSTGHPVQGGVVMLAFGLGTLPNLLILGGLAGRTRTLLRRRGMRWLAVIVLGGAGVYGIVHALHAGTANFMADGFFCRVAPAWFGR